MNRIALLVAALLIVGCQAVSVAGLSSCRGLDQDDCEAAELAAKRAAPAGYGTIASVDIERDQEGCFFGICQGLRATVQLTYWNTDDVVTVVVERSAPGWMKAVSVETERR